jgi:trigger factor
MGRRQLPPSRIAGIERARGSRETIAIDDRERIAMTPTSTGDSDKPSLADEISVKTEETSSVLRTVHVTVDRARVRKTFDKTYRDLGRTAQVRGFRKGKVPRSVLQKLYGASVPEEIERTLVSETLEQAIAAAGVEPVSRPEVETHTPDADVPFEYTLRVEVKPTIELPDIEGLPATRPAVEVDEKEIEQRLERERQGKANLIEEPEECEAADGHTLTIDFNGRMDGEFFEGGSAEGVDLELGSGRMIPGFEEQLKGAKAGDQVLVQVSFPEDYGSEELKGKDAEFDCTVHTLRRSAVPELDDEFAKDVGEFETLDELRQSYRAEMVEQRQHQADHALHRSVVDTLIERADFEVPPGVVERQLETQIESMKQQFGGQLPEEILNQQLARMREDGRPEAERRVRESYLLEAVVQQEGIEVAEEEVDARLEEMAEAQGVESAQMREFAEQQGWRGAIQAELAEKKALSYLASKAEVTTEVSEPEDTEEPETSED